MGTQKGASGYVPVYKKIHASLNFGADIDNIPRHAIGSNQKASTV